MVCSLMCFLLPSRETSTLWEICYSVPLYYSSIKYECNYTCMSSETHILSRTWICTLWIRYSSSALWSVAHFFHFHLFQIWPPKSFKDSGSRFHSQLKEAIAQVNSSCLSLIFYKCSFSLYLVTNVVHNLLKPSSDGWLNGLHLPSS